MSTDAYKLGPSVQVPRDFMRACFWCGKSLEGAESFWLLGAAGASHGRCPSDCPDEGEDDQ